MKILGIDQASSCGWCCGDTLYGVWDLSTRKDESSGMKMIRFRSKLKEVIASEGIGLVVYERVAGQYKNSIIHAAKMVAMIETTCEELGVQYASFSATEIKKFATGSGNANKQKMVESAKAKHGYEGKDDNIADAIFIYQMAKVHFKA